MTLLVEILQFVVAIAALIIIHELGHFVAMRLFHVEVEEFGIGFPPRALTLFTIGGTRYSLNWLPFGGFVRPKGDNDPEIEGGLAAASPWARLGVFLAGPIANLLVGVLLFSAVFARLGAPDTRSVQITGLASGAPAESAGLLVGDLVLKVNDTAVTSMDSLKQAIAASLEKPTTITYQRGEQTSTVTLTPRRNPPEGQGAIGINMGNPMVKVNLIQALPMGASAVVEYGRTLLSLPVRLAQGTIAPEEGRLVGFKGMFDIYQDMRQNEPATGIPAGVSVMLFFTNITISLGLLNLLPIPSVDGGRILFVLPEILLGKRIPPKYENLINVISFAAVLVLLIYINLQDFINPIQLPSP